MSKFMTQHYAFVNELMIKIVNCDWDETEDYDEDDPEIIDELRFRDLEDFVLPERLNSLNQLQQYRLVFACLFAYLSKQTRYTWFEDGQRLRLENIRIGFGEKEYYDGAWDYKALMDNYGDGEGLDDLYHIIDMNYPHRPTYEDIVRLENLEFPQQNEYIKANKLIITDEERNSIYE